VASSQCFGKHDRRTQVDRHVRVELPGIERAKAVRDEARRIVDEQADRRQPGGVPKNLLSAILTLKLGGDGHNAFRANLAAMMDVRNNRPAVGQQRFGNSPPDALRRSSDDGGAWLGRHGRLDCVGQRAMTRAANARTPPANHCRRPVTGRDCGRDQRAPHAAG
jgi:hypothetical protein